jgi:serine phosphatase RsbU (regulator of sigma subunit)
MFVQCQYRSEHVLRHDGDVLVAYTDGVGEERLTDIVRSSHSLNAAEICKRTAEPLHAFVAESPQWDDITLVVMKGKPFERDTRFWSGESFQIEALSPK